MQDQGNENGERRDSKMRNLEEKDSKFENETEWSHTGLAIGSMPTDEEPQSFKKRKSSFKEIKRRGSIAMHASIQKLFGDKER